MPLDLEPSVLDATQDGTTVNTDEWGAYHHLSGAQRKHVTVCHTPEKRVWAHDEDGDGVREVHNNTIEGWWTGLRNFLRPFRGVNKIYLHQYLAVHELNGRTISKRLPWTFFAFYVASHKLPHEPVIFRP